MVCKYILTVPILCEDTLTSVEVCPSALPFSVMLGERQPPAMCWTAGSITFGSMLFVNGHLFSPWGIYTSIVHHLGPWYGLFYFGGSEINYIG